MDKNSLVIKEESINISKDFLEMGLDSLIKDGVLRDIPIFGTLFSLTKIGLTIQDKILFKKIYYFLNELNHLGDEEKREFIEKIESNTKYKNKVNESLLLIIERINDYTKSEYIGKLFAATILGKLDYVTFLKLSNIIDKCFCEDLENLIPIFEGKIREVEDIQIDELYNLGLLSNKGISGDTFLHNQDDNVPNTKIQFVINKYGKIIVELVLKNESTPTS